MRVARLVGCAIILVLAATTVEIAPAAAGGQSSSLPPAARKELAAIFNQKVKPFGLRVTRAALVNPAQKRDRSGTHLAIYVEPTGDYTPDDYINGTVDVSKVFLPYVFTRWKDLKSFDVCQEPRPAVDNRETPAPETQVFATRSGSKLVDWKTVDVATMIDASQAEAGRAADTKRPARFSLYVTKHLQNTPAYEQVVGTATTSPSTPTSPTVRDYD